MTRKDYVCIAEAMREARPWNADANPYAPGPMAWVATVCSVAHRLMQDNARFDCGCFLTACGASWDESEKRYIARGPR